MKEEIKSLQDLKNKFIEYRDTLNLDKNITFGIEIEYENILNYDMTYFLHCILDLNDWNNDTEVDIMEYYNNQIMNGEVKSPVLTDTIDNWKKLSELLNFIRKHNGIVSYRCGTHINIGAHIFKSIENYLNFILLWTLYENEIYSFFSGEFKKVREREKGIIDKISYYVRNNLEDISNYNIPLFNQNNDVSFIKVKSTSFDINNVIEFRVPNGTLNEAICQNYINFCTKFLLASKKELDIEKTIYKIQNNKHNIFELIDYIFDEDIDKDNFLIQSLKLNQIYNKKLLKHKTYE